MYQQGFQDIQTYSNIVADQGNGGAFESDYAELR